MVNEKLTISFNFVKLLSKVRTFIKKIYEKNGWCSMLKSRSGIKEIAEIHCPGIEIM
jgi:hypothetical protein